METVTRQELVSLLALIPESELTEAKRFLESLIPDEDSEPLTDEAIARIQAAKAESGGISQEDLIRRFYPNGLPSVG